MMILNDQPSWFRSICNEKTPAFENLTWWWSLCQPFHQIAPLKNKGSPFPTAKSATYFAVRHTFLTLLKHIRKKKQEIFQRKSLNSQKRSLLFFFSGHQGATNISTSCQLRYQTPSLETDGFLKVGPLPVPQLAIYKAMARKPLYISNGK